MIQKASFSSNHLIYSVFQLYLSTCFLTSNKELSAVENFPTELDLLEPSNFKGNEQRG